MNSGYILLATVFGWDGRNYEVREMVLVGSSILDGRGSEWYLTTDVCTDERADLFTYDVRT